MPRPIIKSQEEEKKNEKDLKLMEKSRFLKWQAQPEKNEFQEEISPSSFIYYKMLGRGAFGEVFLVKKGEKFFAMKILKKDKII